MPCSLDLRLRLLVCEELIDDDPARLGEGGSVVVVIGLVGVAVTGQAFVVAGGGAQRSLGPPPPGLVPLPVGAGGDVGFLRFCGCLPGVGLHQENGRTGDLLVVVPEGDELVDQCWVAGPAGRDIVGEVVAVDEPAHPVAQVGPVSPELVRSELVELGASRSQLLRTRRERRQTLGSPAPPPRKAHPAPVSHGGQAPRTVWGRAGAGPVRPRGPPPERWACSCAVA